ncbi:TPA: hypothetical protein R1W95_000915 [Pseudomonas aeruginosa]|nr:hypothetical protein [Pseudomonas aeruginosa]
MLNSARQGQKRGLQRGLIGLATTTLYYAIFSHAAFAASILPDDPRLKPANVLAVDNGGFTQVYIDGYIHNPTVDTFRRSVIPRGQEFGIVYLNSAGGDLVAAQALGRAIRAKGYATQIGRLSSDGQTIRTGVCESACPIAFVGGKFRLLDSGTGKLAVHRFYLANQGKWASDSKLLFTAERDLSRYIDEMGISREFFDLIMRTPADRLIQIGKPAIYDWALASGTSKTTWKTVSKGTLLGRTESSTGTLSISFSCEQGLLNMEVQANPWFPGIALLNYDQHSLSVDGTKFSIDEVQVSQDELTGYLSFRSVPSSLAVSALHGAKQVGYIWSFERSPGEYSRVLELPESNAQLNEIVSSCTTP